ncbi:MAG: hypothetical protein WD669_10480 [Pirellulales bacterium]
MNRYLITFAGVACTVTLTWIAPTVVGQSVGSDKAVTIEEIKAAWQAQLDSVPAFEVKLSETVDVPQSMLDRIAESRRARGRKSTPFPAHRQEHRHLIVQGKRMFLEERVPSGDEGREFTTSTFFDGEATHRITASGKLHKDGEPQRMGRRTEEPPDDEIIDLLSLKPAFLAFRGLESQVSRINLDDFEIVAQDAATVTVREGEARIYHELVLQRDLGHMPIGFRIFAARGLVAEGTISYRNADRPPYVPETWSAVHYTKIGTTTDVSKTEVFSLTPSIDLASYRLEFPKGTFVPRPKQNDPGRVVGNGRQWSIWLTLCIVVVLAALIIRKRLGQSQRATI